LHVARRHICDLLRKNAFVDRDEGDQQRHQLAESSTAMSIDSDERSATMNRAMARDAIIFHPTSHETAPASIVVAYSVSHNRS
jgi:hypothetical protein